MFYKKDYKIHPRFETLELKDWNGWNLSDVNLRTKADIQAIKAVLKPILDRYAKEDGITVNHHKNKSNVCTNKIKK